MKRPAIAEPGNKVYGQGSSTGSPSASAGTPSSPSTTPALFPTGGPDNTRQGVATQNAAKRGGSVNGGVSPNSSADPYTRLTGSPLTKNNFRGVSSVRPSAGGRSFDPAVATANPDWVRGFNSANPDAQMPATDWAARLGVTDLEKAGYTRLPTGEWVAPRQAQ